MPLLIIIKNNDTDTRNQEWKCICSVSAKGMSTNLLENLTHSTLIWSPKGCIGIAVNSMVPSKLCWIGMVFCDDSFPDVPPKVSGEKCLMLSIVDEASWVRTGFVPLVLVLSNGAFYLALCPQLVQLFPGILLHLAYVVHRQVHPLVHPTEQLSVEVVEQTLLLLMN